MTNYTNGTVTSKFFLLYILYMLRLRIQSITILILAAITAHRAIPLCNSMPILHRFACYWIGKCKFRSGKVQTTRVVTPITGQI